MSLHPPPTLTPVRDATGRFLRGNKVGIGGPGSPNPGRALMNHASGLAGKPESELAAIAKDTSLPLLKRIAAKWYLAMGVDGYSKGGQRLALPDLREYLDRTLGKPAQVRIITADVQLTKRIILELASPDDRKRVANLAGTTALTTTPEAGPGPHDASTVLPAGNTPEGVVKGDGGVPAA